MGDAMSMSWLSCSSIVSSVVECGAPESSKAGKEGREGMSMSWSAWIRRHTLDGVSRYVAILRFE